MKIVLPLDQASVPEIEFEHSAILIIVNKTMDAASSVYEAVRCAWKLNPKRAGACDLVMAVYQRIVIGVFIAERWIPATVASFPTMKTDVPRRWGFVGREAPAEIGNIYLMRRVPDAMRPKGAANPIMYSQLGGKQLLPVTPRPSLPSGRRGG
ncbi:hypothetical protein [Acidisphaera rubrifaciens]|uniref:Uncharacterized protein n=1 Tax=Acidisphaera rubrifaciens HS-AP3 TaxID=1231350 RepID=A0A0D6PAH0_9PROT|nr:hypothetical protein [Acidisphaera rubrifaciens]GAN77869.1 hypothetical protein Asru_0489_03 [Acidisphaera rubrifaciens HS-AP3]